MQGTRDSRDTKPRAAVVAAAVLAALSLLAVAMAVVVMLSRSPVAPSGGPASGSDEASGAEPAGDPRDVPDAAGEERGGQVESSSSRDADEGEPREGAPAPPSGPVTEERSVDVVGEFLFALQEGRVEQAMRYTTRRFRENHPDYAERNSGAFADFEVTAATGSGGAWEVGVKEMWDTGPKEAVFRVVSTSSGPRIDSVVR